MKEIKLLDEVYNILVQDGSKLTDIWLNHIVFSWRWWLLLGLSIIPWIIWIKIRNKNDTVRLLFVGLIVAMVSNTLDTIGINYGRWHYDWKVFPLLSLYLPWDLTLFPVSIMLMLQYMPKINKYIKAITYSFTCSFIFEPFFSWLSLYDKTHWKYWYSFIIYIFLYLCYDYLYKSKLLQHQSKLS